MPQLKKLIIPIALVLLGAGLGEAVDSMRHQQCREAYLFINPREVCVQPDAIKKTGYVSTQNAIEKFIESEKEAGHASDVSVYFRDLENGPIFGIDETADFAPASLLKLPLALVYLTQAEHDPDILNKQLSVSEPKWSFSVRYRSLKTIDPREPHTVEDLLRRMLMYSDNNSYGVLQTHLIETGQSDAIRETLLELGILDPVDIYDEVLSVRRYGAIFRALYNVSYLNATLSEKVLSWLSESDFSQGLAGGIPERVALSHKFGERIDEREVKQLHDCGIIYFPKNPYLLCVMTRGNNFDELSAIIRHVSNVVYQEVDSRKIQ